MPRGWVWEDIKDEVIPRWGAVTATEIQSHKEVAAKKIEAALQELYLATGIFFEVSSRHYNQDELNASTQWVTREFINVSLIGKI